MKNFYHILVLSFESKPEKSLIEAAYKALVKLEFYLQRSIYTAMNRFIDIYYLGLSGGSNVTTKTRDLQQDGSTKLQSQDFPRGYVPKTSSISRVSLAWPLTHALSRRSCKRSNTSDITAINTCHDVLKKIVLTTVAVSINCDTEQQS